jgi:hypothetical protein
VLAYSDLALDPRSYLPFTLAQYLDITRPYGQLGHPVRDGARAVRAEGEGA